MPKKFRDTNTLQRGNRIPAMKFITDYCRRSGKSLRELGPELGTTHQTLSNWADRTKSARMRAFGQILCRFRKRAGLTWAQFGKMLDEEFGE